MLDIPKYKIIRELGKGGMATVYLALQQGLDREVALKILSPFLNVDESFGERFVREAKIIASMSHPHIVTVYDVGQHQQHNYIAMEYHNGGDLKDRIEQGLEAKDGIKIISTMAKALDFAHAKGYIHRDVKPENILFTSSGEPVLSDFGIAKATNSNTQMTQSGSVIGSPRYMSPEQARGHELDGRADIYALGVILYEILTGSVPFDGEDSVSIGIKHITEPVPALSAELSQYQHIIDSFMAKSPDDRYQTGTQAAIELDRYAKNGTTTSDATEIFNVVEDAIKSSTVSSQKKQPGLILFVLLAIAIVALSLWIYTDFEANPDNTVLPNTAEIADENTQKKNQQSVALTNLQTKAEQAIISNKLTTPVESSAFHYFTEMLKIDPENQNANLGMQKITSQYLLLIEQALQQNNFESAEKYLQQATIVSAEDHRLQDMAQQITDARNQFQQQPPIKTTNNKQSNTESLKKSSANVLQQLQIRTLLESAERRYNKQHYAIPLINSAAKKYSTVIALEPTNKTARTGLRNIIKRLDELIIDAKANNKAIEHEALKKAKKQLLQQFAFLATNE